MFNTVGKPELLSQTVETEIENVIRQGLIPPGEKLPSEHQLCDQFGVSRTVMREALRMLSARNLLRIEKGRGIFVNKPTVDSVASPMELYLHMHGVADSAHDVIIARTIIEPSIAALAAENRTEAEADRLLRNVRSLASADPHDHKRLAELDMAFHSMIAEFTHNSVLPLLSRPIQLFMPYIKKDVYDAIGNAHEAALYWHQLIADAIVDHKPESAREAMSGHLEVAAEHVQTAMLAKRKADRAALTKAN